MTTTFSPTVIAFDADDTLWVNEPYFQEIEQVFCRRLGDFAPEQTVSEQLFLTEMRNLEMYGYGAKGFTLSMIETAINISKGEITAGFVADIIKLGRSLLTRPIELLDGVAEVLPVLYAKFRLVLATKGDLLDQQRKLDRSGLSGWFHHIEIMSHKTEDDYRRLMDNLGVEPGGFLMVGNSVKSDVQPVVAAGGHAVWIPYHTTWKHEEVAAVHPKGYIELHSLYQLPALLGIQYPG